MNKKINIKKVTAIQISKIGGLKCDNSNCDWADMSIGINEYKKYINYRCPKCNFNILTRKSYLAFKLMIKIINMINFILPKRTPDKIKNITVSCKFSDNGEIIYHKKTDSCTNVKKDTKIHKCCRCGGEGKLITTYDKEQIVCKNCKVRTAIEYGDYYDEGFMDGLYVIPQWNRGEVNFLEKLLKED